MREPRRQTQPAGAIGAPRLSSCANQCVEAAVWVCGPRVDYLAIPIVRSSLSPVTCLVWHGHKCTERRDTVATYQ
jgi:hypothetical protein